MDLAQEFMEWVVASPECEGNDRGHVGSVAKTFACVTADIPSLYSQQISHWAVFVRSVRLVWWSFLQGIDRIFVSVSITSLCKVPCLLLGGTWPCQQKQRSFDQLSSTMDVVVSDTHFLLRFCLFYRYYVSLYGRYVTATELISKLYWEHISNSELN